MENLIQVLIFLFIIYFIFGAAFGKKKPQDKTSEGTGGEGTTRPSPTTEDVLEMFGFKIPKTGDEYEQPLPQPEVKKRTKLEEITPQAATSELTTPTVMEEVKEEKAFADNVKAYEVIQKSNERAISLKEKIKSPTTLRELILVTEILNKPKAFRS